jgi:SAM-dependent methyltransferase
MDAEALFRIWRRILREDALQQAVFAPDFRERADELGLSPEELELAAEFRAHADLAHWALDGYRYRLVSATVSRVRANAPMVVSVLHAHGHALRTVAERFQAAIGWRDDGLNFHRTTCDFLNHVRDDAAFAGIPGLADAVALEHASNQLLRRVAGLPPQAWVAPPTPPLLDHEARYECAPGAIAVTLEHVLTPWIEDPAQAGAAAVEPGRQHILVYLTSLAMWPGYVGLTPAGKSIFDRLQEGPLSLVEVTALLGSSQAEARARSLLIRFLNLGVIRPHDAAGRREREGAVFELQYGAHWNEAAKVRPIESNACVDAIIDSVVKECGDLAGKRVLDVGTGSGLTVLSLARQGAHALGVDISEHAIEAARAHVQALNEEAARRCSFQVMDATRLDLADDSFDVVACIKTLWCFPDVVAVLREFHRVLRKGGRLVIQLWTDLERCSMLLCGHAVVRRFAPSMGLPRDRISPFLITPESFGRQLEEAGFSGPFAPPVLHAPVFDVTGPEHYWKLYPALSDTGYYVYALLPADIKAAMDEQWRMETHAWRGPSGAVPLALHWRIYTIEKT